MTEHNVGEGLLININTLTFHYLFTTFQSFTTFLTQLLLTIHQTVHLYSSLLVIASTDKYCRHQNGELFRLQILPLRPLPSCSHRLRHLLPTHLPSPYLPTGSLTNMVPHCSGHWRNHGNDRLHRTNPFLTSKPQLDPRTFYSTINVFAYSSGYVHSEYLYGAGTDYCGGRWGEVQLD